jgi:hypothetical protein
MIHRVSALADMHRAGDVIEAAHEIRKGDLVALPRERRASHLLDVSRGYLQWGKREGATTALLVADQLAPQEVRCRRLTKQIMSDLVQNCPRGSPPSARVQQLARAMGVPA